MYSKLLAYPWNSWTNISANLHFIFLFLVVLTIPVDVDIQFGSMAIILSVINWFLGGNYKAKFTSLFENKVGLLIILFYILHLVGLFRTEDMDTGLIVIERKSALLFLPLVIFSTPVSDFQRDFLLFTFMAVCLLLACIGLGYGIVNFNAMISNEKGPEHLVTYISNIHRVYFSIYLVFNFFLVFYFYRKYNLGARKLFRFTALFVAFLFSFFILIMTSRIVLIILINTIAVLVFYFLILKRKQYVIAGVIALIGLFIGLLVYTKVEYVRVIVNDLVLNFNKTEGEPLNSVNLRVEKYKSALQAIKANWVLGVGTGDVQNTLNNYYRINNFEPGYLNSFNAHNQYFQTWLGLGLPGIFVFCLMLILSFAIAIKSKNYLLIYFILIFSLSCISESLLTTQKGIVFFAFFFPLLVSDCNKNREINTPLNR